MDVPEWMRDVSVPTDEQFAELDRARAQREAENEAYAMRLLIQRRHGRPAAVSVGF